MKILGYSERGIINSLIFSIGEDRELINDFIGLINIPELKELGEPSDCEILLEQSFSDFGDADLIIILDYGTHKSVVFIEGKVKTFYPKSWSLHKQFDKYKQGEYKGYSSNLFYQLYLKSLLFQKKEKIKWGKDKVANEDKVTNFKDVITNCGVRNRKIGGNKIVWKALKKIDECDKAFYVGLVPSTKEDIKTFNKKLIDYPIHFLTWEAVHNFCKDNEKLEKVLEIFEYNDGQIY